ncbi:MAG: phosphatidylserine decarboxylase [Blautia sp.]|nr:phosphatidylserine decarboxylase [Blautia sp.]MDY3999703.1 phosphatidylserine decarboxylase [Blautia sp.]
MKYIDRKGNMTIEENEEDKLVRHLYTDRGGRLCLKMMIQPWFSRLAGAVLDTGLSARLVPGFARRNRIDMSEYEERRYYSFREFFIRKARPEARPAAEGEKILVSPCDGRLSVHRIGHDSRFYIQEKEYSLKKLLRSENLAKRYEDGYAVVIRLTLEDGHRFCYAAEGVRSSGIALQGNYHASHTPAEDTFPVYQENAREYCLLQTVKFGTILMMELGKVCNIHKGPRKVNKGEEKGYFEFGGSTVILFLQHGRVRLDYDLMENTENGFETIVKMGERIGEQKLPKRAGKASGRTE